MPPTTPTNWARCHTRPMMLPTLSALELALRDLGAKVEPGAGIAAAQIHFANAA